MPYIQGNLALQTKKKKEQEIAVKETRRTVVRKKSIPMQEKLLYLFTVGVCVLVAGTIIFRYAQIYEMNMEIKTLNAKFNQLAADNKELEKKVQELSDPGKIAEQAQALGMVQSNLTDRITVKVGDDSAATAMKE